MGSTREVPLTKFHNQKEEEDVVLLEKSHDKRGTLLLTRLPLFELILSADYNIQGPEIRLKVLSLLVDEVSELVYKERHF